MKTKHKADVSVMTYRGHHVLNTLIRCYFSPAHTTAQQFVYTGSAVRLVLLLLCFCRCFMLWNL